MKLAAGIHSKNTQKSVQIFYNSSHELKQLFDLMILFLFRWKSGVASSLNYVKLTNEQGVSSPILHPYPNWQANTIQSEGSQSQEFAAGRTAAKQAEAVNGPLADNSTIVSTFRIRVDECDRLWVMDTGLADILGNPKQFAPPALVIFDLKTDQLIRRYTFTPSDIKSDTFFANVVSNHKGDSKSN